MNERIDPYGSTKQDFKMIVRVVIFLAIVAIILIITCGPLTANLNSMCQGGPC